MSAVRVAVIGCGHQGRPHLRALQDLGRLAGPPRPLTAGASTARLFPGKRGATAPEAARSQPYDVEDLAFGHVRFDSGFEELLAKEAG